MGIEQQVRSKHAQEDRLRCFLTAASIMKDREIELALARIADYIDRGIDHDNSSSKLSVLETYYDLRRSGLKKYLSMRRTFNPSVSGIPRWQSKGTVNFGDHMISSLASFSLVENGQILAADDALKELVSRLAP